MTIRLKCWPRSWDAIVTGDKTAEVRSSEDRTFSVGDILELERWDPIIGRPAPPDVGHSGIVAVRITHVDVMAGDVNFIGVRLTKGDTPGTLVRLVVLSFYVMGIVRA